MGPVTFHSKPGVSEAPEDPGLTLQGDKNSESRGHPSLCHPLLSELKQEYSASCQVLVAFTGPCEVMAERKSFQVTRPKDSVKELRLPQGLCPLSPIPIGSAAGTRKVTQGQSWVLEDNF